MKQIWKKSIVHLAAFVCILTFGIHIHAAVPDFSGAVEIDSKEEAVEVLKKARAEHKESILMHVDPSVVQIENEKEGWADVHSSIYREFDYGYSGGLFNAMDYDVFSGPSVNRRFDDPDNEAYQYYEIVFAYHDNEEELKKADEKIRSVLSKVSGKTDGEKVSYVYNYLKKNLPEPKDSANGYERNSNGVYGALFGDGTGYVCATYACTIQRFMEVAKIPSYIISGAYKKTPPEPCHAVNAVKISGRWYIIDYTQDALLIGKEDFEKYFSFEELTEKYLSSRPVALKNYSPAQEKPEEVKKPGRVLLKSAASAGYDSVLLKWGKVSNADEYEIFISSRKNGGFKKLETVKKNGQSFTAKKLTSGKKYYFKVRACNKTGKGMFSRVLQEIPVPEKATMTKAANISRQRIVLSWKKVRGANGYEVFCRTGSRLYQRVKTLSGTRFVGGKQFKKGKKYSFKVRAYRKISGKKVYGAFSTPKTIAVKR